MLLFNVYMECALPRIQSMRSVSSCCQKWLLSLLHGGSHPCTTSCGLQVISVDLHSRGAVDLSSFVARVPLIRTAARPVHGRLFLPEGFHTPEIFARDYFYLQQLLQHTDRTKELHQTLVFHQ